MTEVSRERLLDEDWYGREMAADTYVACVFRDIDLTEAITRGVTFEECDFSGCRFNASHHYSSAFIACRFRQTSFFGATFDDCKMIGSMFVECTLRPMTVHGGQWRGVTMRGARLTGLDLSGLPLQEADFAEADLSEANLSGCDLSGASFRGAKLHRTDLRRSTLDRVDVSAGLLRDTRLDLHGAVRLAENHGADVDLT